MLGATSEKWSYWLLPLIESGLPEETLRAWQRSSLFKVGGSNNDDMMGNLMKFLKEEVLAEERISRAKASSSNSKPQKKAKDQRDPQEEIVATAAGLHISEKSLSCIFCDGHHESSSCGKAQSLTLEERRSRVQNSGSCYLCLRKGHVANTCKAFVKCLLCEKKHHAILCPSLADCKKLVNSQTVSEPENPTSNMYLSQASASEVLLQTLMVKVHGQSGEKTARILLDSGSQRSYIRSSVTESLDLEPIGVEWLSQTVFGGSTSAAVRHCRYKFAVSSVKGNVRREIEALDQNTICGKLPRLRNGPWLKELEEKGVWIPDFGEDTPEIDILIGSDWYGELLTGRKLNLGCGLIALETLLGWTVLGRIETDRCSSLVSQVFRVVEEDAQKGRGKKRSGSEHSTFRWWERGKGDEWDTSPVPGKPLNTGDMSRVGSLISRECRLDMGSAGQCEGQG